MKIRIAFYKGKGDVFNKIVRKWTQSEYSHAELILADGRTWISITPFIKSKIYSKKDPEYKEKDWDFVELPITRQQHSIIEQFYSLTEGCKYDWVGMLLSQFMPFKIKSQGKWYCSEWIAYALRISGVISWEQIQIYDQTDLSPVVLYNLVNGNLNAQGSKI